MAEICGVHLEVALPLIRGSAGLGAAQVICQLDSVTKWTSVMKQNRNWEQTWAEVKTRGFRYDTIIFTSFLVNVP